MDPIRVTMISPTRAKCGVTDYTAYLTEALRPYADLRRVVDPREYRVDQEDADVVHVQHQYFFFGGVAPWKNRFGSFVKRLGKPAVMTVHEYVAPEGPPHVRAAIRLTNRIQFGKRAIRTLLVHTEEDRRKMAAGGFDPERIVVVRHGVPVPLVLPNRDEAKRALGLEGRFVVTLFGFLSRRKGHGIAIEALRSVPNNAMLLLAGGRHPDDKSDYAAMLETMIRSEGLADRVKITGYLPDAEVAPVMAAADLVIAPFTEASGSGSLALAFACGKPIIASDIAPHREMERDALRLVRNDPTEWAEAIRSLMASEEEREALAQGAAKYAARHTYGHMAEETVAVYRSVLNRAVV